MDNSNVHSLISTLSSDLDELETALAPLLNTPLSTLTPQLPLLDKAKLYALSTYSIESLIFNYLRLAGVDAKAHPVFAELARVKQYFDKIKKAEDPEAGKPTLRVDKEAARRFVTAGLAGNGPVKGDAKGEKRKVEAEVIAETSEGSAKRPKRDKKDKRRKNQDGESTYLILRADE